MPGKAKFYFTRDRVSGKYKIIDRGLHGGMVIAVADFKEAATLITLALTESFKVKPDVKSTARTAALADILLPHQLNSRYLSPWIDGRFEPPPRS